MFLIIPLVFSVFIVLGWLLMLVTKLVSAIRLVTCLWLTRKMPFWLVWFHAGMLNSCLANPCTPSCSSTDCWMACHTCFCCAGFPNTSKAT